MRKVRVVVIGFLALLAIGLAACVTAPSRVSTEVTVCCDAPFFQYATFQVNVTNAPGFLEPYLSQGILPVLQQKGLEPTNDTPDLMVNVDFKQTFLDEYSNDNNSFGESVDPAGANRFMAAVSVDVVATDTQQIVWSGRLSRIHHNSHGQPRGNDHKMQGIIDGFVVLFDDYPVRLTDERDTGTR